MIENPTVKLSSENGYVFDIGDLEFNNGLETALIALDNFLGPFKGEPGSNTLEIYEIDGWLAAGWTHFPTDAFIYRDGSWTDQNDD